MEQYDLIIVGGGMAGICSAIEAKRCGLEKVLIIEKEEKIGYQMMKSEYIVCNDKKYTGKGYRLAMLQELIPLNVEVRVETTVLKIEEDNSVACICGRKGIEKIKGKAIILATGARELGINEMHLEGDCVSGIYTVTSARQALMSSYNKLGKRILIIGDTELERIAHLLQDDMKEVVGLVGDYLDEAKKLKLSEHYYEGYDLAGVYGTEKLEYVMLKKGDKKVTIPCDALIFAQPLIGDEYLAMKSGLHMKTALANHYELDGRMVFACGRCLFADQTMEETRKNAQKAVEAIVQRLAS